MTKPKEQIKEMVKDVEIIESFLGNKGRFVGDMVHISIRDLADLVEKMKDGSCAVANVEK